MNTRQFVNAHNIRADVAYADANPNMANDEWSRNANHWRVVLKMGRRQLTVPFSTGSALSEPDAADVLDCLASDAGSIEYVSGFEEWANELGFDPDSRKAERTFEVSRRQSLALKRFLGDELYETLLNDTERL